MSHKWNQTELGWAIRDLEDDSLTSHEKLLLLIFNCCSDSDHKFFGSFEKFASMTSMHKSTCKRKVKSLIKKQYIILLNSGNGIEHKSNEYRINIAHIATKIPLKMYKYITKKNPYPGSTGVPAGSTGVPGWEHKETGVVAQEYKAGSTGVLPAITNSRDTSAPTQAAPRGSLAAENGKKPKPFHPEDFAHMMGDEYFKAIGWE